MNNDRRRACRRSAFSGFPALLFLAGLYISCASHNSIRVANPPPDASVRYTVLYLIHGDADYLYHDTSRTPIDADERMVYQAKIVARGMKDAEVFIMHQKPEGRKLIFFPSRENEYWYYRSGRLQIHSTLQRSAGRARFADLSDLIVREHARNATSKALVFYYGHEIPEQGGEGYDESNPEYHFTIDTLVSGLKGIRASLQMDTSRFDLIVLSTCYNATPGVIAKVGPLAKTMLASPENLHLSYMNSTILKNLDSLGSPDAYRLAEAIAQDAFSRLVGEVQTAVSISLFDLDAIGHLPSAVAGAYTKTIPEGRNRSLLDDRHCDCAEVNTIFSSLKGLPVKVWYRPPQFGKMSSKVYHSGWECWKELSIGHDTSTGVPQMANPNGDK